MRWVFGDQLGEWFLEGVGGDEPVLMVEARGVLGRRRFHRAKAHLVLSAMRHRAAELGERVRYVRADTYRQGVRKGAGKDAVTVCQPTSRKALAFVEGLEQVEVLPARGWLVSRERFGEWAGEHSVGGARLEDFYRWVRREHGLLMDGDDPAGGTWNLDQENRQPPPRDQETLEEGKVWAPEEDEIDAEVRHDLDRWESKGLVAFTGLDGPRRFPATREEARAALRHFVRHRLADFGPYEDAMMAADGVLSHSRLSAALNLGLLHPAECVAEVERAWRDGHVPLSSAEGYVRQVAGWREYTWQLYWHFGEDYRRGNALGHTEPLPRWFEELDADAVTARCLSTVLAQVRDTGWTHHIPRLMVLGSRALQDGWDPAALMEWFHRSFVDGYDWVMLPNVLGMSQYADDGQMATKPYTSAGAYINRMSDFCGGCAYRPGDHAGDRACPYTVGYWAFLDRHRDHFAHHYRMARTVKNLDRLSDLDALREQAAGRGASPP
ncbi:cryptochrome/photolyase family protein [Streptomyces sp. NPDC049879]|uniref:cryptochrome/photolyase family protein n=1 Tax=Streptomyces sp. NPDC049879 TaxID=3365598 RepID=UPI003790A887